ncbi:3-hydroxyanthranilate 3,4-dioxygenase [Aliiglaciecola sp. CAU 1673]|uniref:3-hydroxyanthranilate 3,4-dioxygenase n=1 Tax=Aliiglaciecola sp. CAU 1673 TaxID=3032595 RepID=UPI0023DC5355|nr:3-hydroxyanthranilate 3,4-dioxygenase [Aliiglaciecola sp. CAU 1673]MDF2176815.1 3-hydroxyanthranilate 3,4-dioxygenase [Aliiglaciecola sp. CAU 1673]
MQSTFKMVPPLNFQKWIAEHSHQLKPPVCNKQVFDEGDFIVMVVGGPNGRRDYHYNEGPEFFYQLEGEMELRLMVDGKRVVYPIRAGEIFLLPPKTPHSPVRFANSLGLVIEQKRRLDEGEKDGLMWFCDHCDHKLYEEYFPLRNIEKDFHAVFERFFSSEEHRTCDQCGTVMPASNKLE